MTWVQQVLALVSPSRRPASTCEACGGEFTCGAALTGCWCRDVEVPKDVRETLRERYSRCLCRSCLEAAASGGAGGIMGGDVEP